MQEQGPVQVGVAGYCFAADCIFSFEAVKRRTAGTLKTMEELLAFIKQRAAVEESYSKSLLKLSQQSIVCTPGTLNDGLESMRGDIVNSSTQRKQFSEHLMTDVYDPMNECRNKVANAQKYLVSKVQRLQKQLKNSEEQYVKACIKYEKCYRELAQSLAACREHGAKEPNLSSDPGALSVEDIRSSLSASSATTSSRQIKKSRPFSSPFSKRSTSSDSAAPSDDGVSPSQGSKLVHWLLPTDEERKHELTATATQNLWNAELARRACWDAWKEITEMSHNGAIEYMHALADFQTLEEECINTMQDHLKKMTVFECSAVANQQYDLQMLFKVLESISCSKDLVSFLRAQSTASQEGQAPPAFADMVGRGSCVPFTALPPPPTARRLEGPPFMEDDIPVESTINLEVQLTMPSLYRSSSARTHEHLQGEEHESEIECNLVPSQEIVETLKKMERKGRSSSSDSKSDCGTPSLAIPTLRLTVSSNQLYPLDEDEASSDPSAERGDSANRVPALQLDEPQAQIVADEHDNEGDDTPEPPRLPPSDKDTPRLSEHEEENQHDDEANEQVVPTGSSTTKDSGNQPPEDEPGEGQA